MTDHVSSVCVCVCVRYIKGVLERERADKLGQSGSHSFSPSYHTVSSWPRMCKGQFELNRGLCYECVCVGVGGWVHVGGCELCGWVGVGLGVLGVGIRVGVGVGVDVGVGVSCVGVGLGVLGVLGVGMSVGVGVGAVWCGACVRVYVHVCVYVY